MMASSSSSSNLSDHLLQDELRWPSSSLPFAPALHSANHQWSQPLMLNSSNELEELLSSQAHHHSHQASSPVIPPQLSSLLMMQELGFQWSNCGSADSTAMLLMSGQQDGQSKIKEEERRECLNSRSPCAAGTDAIAYHDIVGGCAGLPAMAAADMDGTVLPSINISRPLQNKLCPAPPLPVDAFEILASSRLCKTLLLGQASSVLLHNGMPFLRSEHVPYGPPPSEAAVHPQGPCIENYKALHHIVWVPSVVNGMGGDRRWSDENNAACHQKTSPSSSPAPLLKKPRLESRSSSSTITVPSFKVRKEKLGDRIAALQQLVSPFGKTLSGPYLRSSRSKKPKTRQRGSPNANETRTRGNKT
ncbi:hypothetical protein PR202_ga23778 [Eleusine coracana subsp. coracana]|uniref:Uncharacterized protein n=1 Tax=Eleusine coracana subsp. coracana TaxID=191504 RepID=A0AAV5D732_ELECO|nr:hypothetical protein PR202_ga23778 [Eleusine coracana subsp. coracana]